MTLVDYWLLDFRKNWKQFLGDYRSILNLGLTILIFIFVTYSYRINLVKFEQIQGLVLDDIILDWIPSYDLSLYIFVLMYFMVFYTIIFMLAYPILFNYTFALYAVVLGIRLLMLYFINLEPPIGMILMKDPILAMSTYNGISITKDLFFSGHCISIFVCYFCVPNLVLKRIFKIFSFIFCVMLLIQHVHYTIDIVGAYIVVFLGYKIYFRQQILNVVNKEQYSKPLVQIEYT